jgi:hypothetical protein
MSNHKIALVPLASGYMQSPELLARGRKADTGIFAESLLYYDSVYVHVDNPEQFTDFISLLIQQGLTYESLNELVEEGTLRFFNTVLVLPFMGYGLGDNRRGIVSGLYAIQEKAMLEPNYFTERFLKFDGLQSSFSALSTFDKKSFDKFCERAQETALSFSAEDIGDDLVDNALEDFLNPERCRLITKSILTELYRVHRLGKAPNVKVKVREMDGSNYDDIANNLRTSSAVVGRHLDDEEYRIYEVDYGVLISHLKSLEVDGKPLIAFPTIPLSCAGLSNLYIKAAGKLKCDLFLSKPVSKIVGNKLYEISDFEISRSDIKIKNVIDKLEAKVKFPDLRRLINSDEIDFNKVLEIRQKAKRFRDWLQVEAERDVDAIIAYHGEVAKESGFANYSQRALKIFGVLAKAGWSILTTAKLKELDEVNRQAVKEAGGRVIDKVFDYGAEKLGFDWKPVCFGDWYKDEIARLLKESKAK